MKKQDRVEQLSEQLELVKQEYRSKIDLLTVAIEHAKSEIKKVHVPIYLESDILSVVQESISKSIQGVLVGYGSPLTKLVSEVIDLHSQELKTIINESFVKVIRTDDFKKSIIDAFSHKVARTIISNNDGLFDKVSNELKQDHVFKAKISLAVANVVEECLNNKQK